MLNQNDKLERFAAQINRTAEKSVQKIEKQTERLSSSALSSFREEARQELETRKAYALTRLERESNQMLAERAAALKKRSADHRAAIVAQVYAEAEKKILAFTETADYLPLLKSCIVSLAEGFSGGRAVVFVRADDAQAAKEICKELPQVEAVRTDDRIRLGLAFAENADGSIHLDDTFESRLAADRARFMAECRLSVLP